MPVKPWKNSAGHHEFINTAGSLPISRSRLSPQLGYFQVLLFLLFLLLWKHAALTAPPTLLESSQPQLLALFNFSPVRIKGLEESPGGEIAQRTLVKSPGLAQHTTRGAYCPCEYTQLQRTHPSSSPLHVHIVLMTGTF